MSYTGCMNWLIVTPPEYASEARDVASFLNAKKAVSLICECSPRIASFDMSCAPSEDFFSIQQNAESATHCVFLHADKLSYSPAVSYAAGFLAGRAIPLFATGFVNGSPIPSLYSAFEHFASVKELTDGIAERFPRYSAEEKKEAARKKLYKKGIPFTPDSFSFQIAQGNKKECELFLSAGMDVNALDSSGTPMVCAAARAERCEIFTLLMKKGANIDAVSKDRGYSAVMDAIWRNNTELVETIVSYKPDLNIVSNDGQTPLVLAVGNGNADVCEILVKGGAKANVKDHMNMTAYEYAKLFKKEKIVEILEKYEENR